jgi:Spy/CpxP family protein refolding chaperone
MTTKFIFRAAASTILLTFSLFAQGTGTPPSPPTPAQMVANQVARLTTLLSLTSAQQTQATTILTTEQTAISGLMAGMQTARTTLQTAIQNNDANTIAAQANQIGTLTTQEVEAHATAQAALYAILTTDQQAKYKQLMSAGPGGHGGPGGPGPGHPGMP